MEAIYVLLFVCIVCIISCICCICCIMKVKTNTSTKKLVCLSKYESDSISFEMKELFYGYEKLIFPSGAIVTLKNGSKNVLCENLNESLDFWVKQWSETGFFSLIDNNMLNIQWSENNFVFIVKKINKNLLILLSYDKDGNVFEAKLFNLYGIRII